MRATLLDVRHFLGVDEIRLAPGQITVISGRNGSGKSSVIAAFQAALGGGGLHNLKRVGSEEEPRVLLELDGGRIRIERQGDDTRVRQRVGDSAAYEDVRRPQEWLDALFDQELTNPMRLLSAKPAEFRDILLEVLPLTLDRAALQAAIGDTWPADKALPGGHPLYVLATVHAELFNERTGVNRTQRDKASYALEANKALPAEMPEDPGAELVRAAQQRDALYRELADKKAVATNAEQQAFIAAQAVYNQEQTRIEGEFKAAAAKLRLAGSEKVADLERQIALLKAEAETAIQEERTKGEVALKAADEVLDQAEREAVEARRKAFAAVDAMQPDLQAAEQRVSDLTATWKRVAQLQEQKRLADRFEKESGDLKVAAERLTEALGAVDALKTQLLADVPIEGLEFRGRDIFIGGVPLEQVNTAQKIRLAVKVAVLRANTKPLPLIWVDGAEALDPEQFKLLEEELLASGVQVVMARVDDGPLKVETREGTPQKVTKMPPPAPTAPRRRAPALRE